MERASSSASYASSASPARAASALCRSARAIVVVDAGGGVPQRREGVARGDEGDGERDGATDRGVLPPPHVPAHGRRQRDDEDRLQRGLVDEEGAAVEQQDRRHRDEHDEAELPAAAPDDPHEHVAEPDTDGDADGDLEHSPQAMRVRDAEPDDGGHGGEEGRLVVQQLLRHPPGECAADGALHDAPPRRADPDPSVGKAAARRGGPARRLAVPCGSRRASRRCSGARCSTPR